MNKIIIGITGYKRSGKDTAAEYFCSQLPNSKTIGFADSIKRMTRALGIDHLEEPYISNKEAIVPMFGKSLRYIWQTLGTEWGRDTIHPNIWVILTALRVRKMAEDFVVISDLRFDNEAEWIKERDGIIIHISRPSADIPWYKRWWSKIHRSEHGIEGGYIDYRVVNDGTVEDFHKKLDEIVEDIIITCVLQNHER